MSNVVDRGEHGRIGAGRPLAVISLEARPRRLLDWREENGRCVLLRPRFGAGRLGRWLARRIGDPHYRIRLDEVGTFVWKASDGRTSLAEVARALRSAFGGRVEPADERLVRFARRMLAGRMIAVDGPASSPDGSCPPGGNGERRTTPVHLPDERPDRERRSLPPD